MATVQGTWNEWKQLLKDALPSTVGIQRKYQEIVDRKKRQQESIEEYFHAKVSLARQSRISDTDIEFVIGGLSDNNIIQSLSTQEFLSFKVLLLSIKRMEDLV